MDIEEFYDADPRRRASEEVPFGHEWTDTAGGRYEVMWIADTGEVYAMFEPIEPISSDGIGDLVVQHMPVSAVTVEALGTVPTRAEIDERLAGWEAEMGKLGSIDWVRARLDGS
jgi:hypothetical protein